MTITDWSTSLDLRAEQIVAAVKQGSVQPGAYTTAQVAKACHADGRLAFPGCLQWLRNNQRHDGSWGGVIDVPSDRLVSTLAAVTTLAGIADPWAHRAIQAGLAYLRRNASSWRASPHEMIAFELTVPFLTAEARKLGLELPYHELDQVCALRDKKLKGLTPELAAEQPTTLLYTLEALPFELPRPKIAAFVLDDGDVGTSPAASAAYWTGSGASEIPSYLAELASIHTSGGFPDVHPVDIFEPAWIVYTLQRAGLTTPSVGRLLNQLHVQLLVNGHLAYATAFAVQDSDDTSMALNVLLDAGYEVAAQLDNLLQYEAADHFRAYPFERGAAISANGRILEALCHAPDRYPAQLAKLTTYLMSMRGNDCAWLDKWHISAYYATQHVVAGLIHTRPDELRGTLNWLLASQHSNGSWGLAGGNPEETAYAIFTLHILSSALGPVPAGIFTAAAHYQRQHLFDDVTLPELWIGKGLYVPLLVVQAAILGSYVIADDHAVGRKA